MLAVCFIIVYILLSDDVECLVYNNMTYYNRKKKEKD